MFLTNGKVITEATFPDGEKNIFGFSVGGVLLKDYVFDTLVWKWEGDEDIITLMLLKKCYPAFRDLKILYLPYSREDRDISGGSRCSLRYICEFIAGLGFATIKVVDPHSDLALAYLGENAYSIYPKLELKGAIDFCDHEKYVVMFPDAGAQKRYGKVWDEFPQIVGTKTRDFATGKITGYAIANGDLADNAFVIIVDDLCSYGGTFVAAGKALLPYRPRWIYLVVTHCEDSIFEGDIFKDNSPIDKVFTTNSLLSAEVAVQSHHRTMKIVNLY
jgi:ribose-phosphate pyrophosphokinase